MSEIAGANRNELPRLLRKCAVKILAREAQGTGFFATPQTVLTCAHVVRGTPVGSRIKLVWGAAELTGTLTHAFPDPGDDREAVYPDVAVIEVATGHHPCVLLGEEFAPRDLLYAYGYSENYPNGESLTADCEGSSSPTPQEQLLKFKATNVVPGLSGAPLLNQTTGAVCGIVKRTRNQDDASGGYAVLMQRIFELLPDLRDRNRRFHEQAEISPWREAARSPPQDALAAYRTYLEESFGRARVFESAALRHIYVEQRLREAPGADRSPTPQSRPSAAGAPGPARGTLEASAGRAAPLQAGEQATLAQLLAGESRQLLVISGRSGQGKSALLAHQALEWIDGRAAKVPLVIELRNYATLTRCGKSFCEYLEDGKFRLPRAQLEPLLGNGGAMLLLDGLDEVFDPDLRSVLIDQIIRTAREYPNSHIIVTTRPLGNADGGQSDFDELGELCRARFRRFTLEDFDPLQAQEFLRKCRESQTPARRQTTDALARDIGESASFRRLAANPLLLTLAVSVGEFANRATLYERCVDRLLADSDVKKRRAAENHRSKRLKREILEATALTIWNDDDGLPGTRIPETRFEQIVERVLLANRLPFNLEALESMQTALTGEDSMLKRVDESYEFAHAFLLDYFYARARCALETGNAGTLAALFRDHWQDFRWTEILPLIGGILAAKAAPLVRDLLAAASARNGYRATFLAARCLAEMGASPEASALEPVVKTELQRLLAFEFPYVYFWNDPEANEFLWIRATAAQRLTRWRDEATRAILVQEVASNSNVAAAAAMVPAIAAAWPDEKTCDWLLGLIEHDANAAVRIAATREIARGWPKEKAREWLLRTVESHTDPQVRGAACSEIAWTCRDAGVREALWACAQRDADQYVQEQAIWSLATFFPGAETTQWIDTMRRTTARWNVRRTALTLRATASADDDVRKVCIDTAAGDSRWSMRQGALLALRQWPDEACSQFILTRLGEDPHPAVRAEAASLCAELWPADATLDVLRQRLAEEPHAETRAAIFRGMLRCQGAHAIALAEGLEFGARQDPRPEIRWAAIYELCARASKDPRTSKDPKSSEPIVALLRERAQVDAAAEVRGNCLWCLARLAAEEAIDALSVTSWLKQRAEADPDEEVRVTAIREIGRREWAESLRDWLMETATQQLGTPCGTMAVAVVAKRWRDARTRDWLIARLEYVNRAIASTGFLRAERLSSSAKFDIEALAGGWRTDETRELLSANLVRPDRQALARPSVQALTWTWPDGRTRALLERLLDDERAPNERLAALEAISLRYRDAAVRSRLEQASRSGNALERSAAINALAYQWRDAGTRSMFEDLAAQDPEPRVRATAIAALGGLWNDDPLSEFFERRLAAESAPNGVAAPGDGSVFETAALRQGILQQLMRW